MSVDYTPTMKPYEKVGAFRYWCQTTLPLVYDDSKSYLELLYSVIHYLNSTISDVANMGDNIDALLEAYTQLQAYVNDYFDNLDVQEEINAKLDEMATDGTLDNLLKPFVQAFVGDWLEEHLTPTTPPIDGTLTISGAGADAKVVGDLIKKSNRLYGFFASTASITYNADTARLESTQPIHVMIPMASVDDVVSEEDNGVYYVTANPYGNGVILYDPDTQTLTETSSLDIAYNYPDYAIISYSNLESRASYAGRIAEQKPNRNIAYMASNTLMQYVPSTRRIESASAIYVLIPSLKVVDVISTETDGIYHVDYNPYIGVMLYNPKTHQMTQTGNVGNAYFSDDYAVITPLNLESWGAYMDKHHIRTYNEPLFFSEAPITYRDNQLHSDRAIAFIIRQMGLARVFGSSSQGYTLENPNGYPYLWFNNAANTLEFGNDPFDYGDDKILIHVFERYTLDNIFPYSRQGKPVLYSSSQILHDVATNRLLSKTAFTILLPGASAFSQVSADGTDTKGYIYLELGEGLFVYYNRSTGKVRAMTYQTTESEDLVFLFTASPNAYAGLDISTRPFINNTYGKKAVCYGDSITWYDGHAYTWGQYQGQIAIGFEHYMRGLLHMDVTNRGISGATIPQICTSLKSATDITSFDFLTLSGGANDERHGTPLGTLLPIRSAFDTTTFYGAIQSAIEWALSQKSTLKIILMTPINGYIQAAGYVSPATGDGYIREDYANAIRRISELYALPLCDWYAHSGMNYFNRNSYYADPPFGADNNLYILHPNEEGYMRISTMLLDTITKA